MKKKISNIVIVIGVGVLFTFRFAKYVDRSSGISESWALVIGGLIGASIAVITLWFVNYYSKKLKKKKNNKKSLD